MNENQHSNENLELTTKQNFHFSVVIFQLVLQELKAKSPQLFKASHVQTLQTQESTINWWERMGIQELFSFTCASQESGSKAHGNPNC